MPPIHIRKNVSCSQGEEQRTANLANLHAREKHSPCRTQSFYLYYPPFQWERQVRECQACLTSFLLVIFSGFSRVFYSFMCVRWKAMGKPTSRSRWKKARTVATARGPWWYIRWQILAVVACWLLGTDAGAVNMDGGSKGREDEHSQGRARAYVRTDRKVLCGGWSYTDRYVQDGQGLRRLSSAKIYRSNPTRMLQRSIGRNNEAHSKDIYCNSE